MKKFIIGLFVGALLMFSSQVYSTSSNLVGTKVAGTMDVNLNKKSMGQAVIIEGKSYLPVRSVAEGMNLKVDVQDKTINLNGLSAEEYAQLAKEDDERAKAEAIKNGQISKIKRDIEILQDYIKTTEWQLSETEKELQTATEGTMKYKGAVDGIEFLKNRLVDLNEQMNKLESELAELEKE